MPKSQAVFFKKLFTKKLDIVNKSGPVPRLSRKKYKNCTKKKPACAGCVYRSSRFSSHFA